MDRALRLLEEGESVVSFKDSLDMLSLEDRQLFQLDSVACQFLDVARLKDVKFLEGLLPLLPKSVLSSYVTSFIYDRQVQHAQAVLLDNFDADDILGLALLDACDAGLLELVKWMCERLPRTDVVAHRSLCELVIRACEGGHLDVLLYLDGRYGITADIMDGYESRLFTAACQHKGPSTLDLLDWLKEKQLITVELYQDMPHLYFNPMHDESVCIMRWLDQLHKLPFHTLFSHIKEFYFDVSCVPYFVQQYLRDAYPALFFSSL